MKKFLLVTAALCLLCVLIAGCDNNPEPRGGSKSTDGGVLDLTALGENLLSAEMYKIAASPDDYFGRTIKIRGAYSASFYHETGLYYHYIVTKYGDSCCQEALEFIWNGDHAYPGDYPEELAAIEVSGVFGSYEELGRTYYYLAVDELTVK